MTNLTTKNMIMQFFAWPAYSINLLYPVQTLEGQRLHTLPGYIS